MILMEQNINSVIQLMRCDFTYFSMIFLSNLIRNCKMVKLNQNLFYIRLMDVEQNLPLILVYYNFRGQLQSIRNLLCFLEIKSIEIYIEQFDKQRKTLDKTVLKLLEGTKIDKSQLPILIHEGQMISDVYPIMSYICYKFSKEDLLGTNIYSKAKVQEIIEMYTSRHNQTISEIFSLADYVVNHTQQQIDINLFRLYRSIIASSGYVREICDHIRSNSNHYVVGQLTILDFLFFESCIYLLGSFDKVDKMEITRSIRKIANKNTPTQNDPHLDYLQILRNYQAAMMSLPFYLKHQKFLESFSVVSKLTGAQKIIGLKKFWVGNPKIIK